MEMWFSEFHTPDVKHSTRVNRQLYSKQSDYQRIDIFETPEFGRVLTQLRQRVQSGRPVSLAAMEGEFTPEEMSHLSYILSKDTSPVSDEALADYLRVIQEEYEGRTRARSEDSLRLLAEQKRSTKQYGG